MFPSKQQLLRLLPRTVQHRLRRWHAPRAAAHFTDADWSVASIVRALVKPGDTVIDVGANIGYITARLAEYVGSSGQVYSIEAVPDTFALLECTLRYLHLDQVRAIHACASNVPGEVTMEIPAYASGLENLYESRVLADSAAGDSRNRRVRVPARPLDDLLSGEGTVTFIKIDVEGHEWEVLQGADDLLRDQQPALYVEVSGDPDQPDSQASRLFARLDDQGYTAYLYQHDVLRPRRAGDHSVDYFFLRTEQIARVRPFMKSEDT